MSEWMGYTKEWDTYVDRDAYEVTPVWFRLPRQCAAMYCVSFGGGVEIVRCKNGTHWGLLALVGPSAQSRFAPRGGWLMLPMCRAHASSEHFVVNITKRDLLGADAANPYVTSERIYLVRTLESYDDSLRLREWYPWGNDPEWPPNVAREMRPYTHVGLVPALALRPSFARNTSCEAPYVREPRETDAEQEKGERVCP